MDWERARPVLEATYRLLAEGGFSSGAAVNQELSRDPDDQSTGAVFDLLQRARYIEAEFVLGSAPPVFMAPTEKGLQQVAGWPAVAGPERAVSSAQLDFDNLDETDFEQFCFELISGLDGFHNVDWRKGTPKQASPADRGRDIAAQVDRADVDATKHPETWFIDCKHYARGVPPEALQGLLARAQA